MSNIRHKKWISTSSIDTSLSLKSLLFAVNLNTKSNSKLVSDSCGDTSGAPNGNGFVEVPWTKIRFSLVLFNDDWSNKSVYIGTAESSIYLRNGTIIVHLKDISLLYVGAYSLISTARLFYLGVAVYDIPKCHCSKI